MVLRIGVLGTDTTHIDEFIRHLNPEGRFPGLRITSALAESPERDAHLVARGITVLPEVADVVAASDGILVTHREGSRHRALAEPGLLAGLATFVDKPLATTHRDAAHLLDLARKSGAAVGSCSAVSVHPAVVAARSRGTTQITFRGPADHHSPYDGLFFYGIHAAETACTIALGPGQAGTPEDVRAIADGDGVVLEALLSGCRLRLELHAATVGFSMDLGEGPISLDLGPDYLAPVTTRIAAVMHGGPVPDPAPTVAAVSLLEQAVRLLAPPAA